MIKTQGELHGEDKTNSPDASRFNGWKILAIVLFIIVILETLFIIYSFNLGTKMIENEYICAINVCENGGYDSFFYDIYTEICYCYADGEVTYEEVLK